MDKREDKIDFEVNNRPIGVFDSGLGGLSVWSAICGALPDESLIYFGDGLNCPYGAKSKQEIERYSTDAVDWLLGQGAKMIVVACNTATAAAIEYLRERYCGVPFVGMEPAVKPAALSTKRRKIAILATEGSFKGELYNRTVSRYGADIEVLTAVGRGFVELVEANEESTAKAYDTVREVIEPLVEAGVDRIVLGCTHYPFLSEQISRVIGDREVEIIDPSPAVARRVEQLLDENNMRGDGGNIARYLFHTLGTEEYLERMVAKSEEAKKMNYK